LNREAIKAAFPFLAQSVSLQDQDNAWRVLVHDKQSEPGYVKISFFGTIGFGRIGEPDCTDDGVMQAASFVDLMATKVNVILQRAEAKDYRDIAAMINAGVSLSQGLAAARLLFGPNFQPGESLKALVFYSEGDLTTLTASEKSTLTTAVKNVRHLPEVTLRSNELMS